MGRPARATRWSPMQAWCRERLATDQVPAFVIFVDRRPQSSVGRLIRAELRGAALAPGRAG